MSATDVPAGAAQPDALGAEEVAEMLKAAQEEVGAMPATSVVSERWITSAYAPDVVALAASHELLRARVAAAEGLLANGEGRVREIVDDVLLARAEAAESRCRTLEQALQEIVRDQSDNNPNRAWEGWNRCRDIARAALVSAELAALGAAKEGTA